VLAGRGARPVELPTYPFQRRRYWLDPIGTAEDRVMADMVSYVPGGAE
jgi:acyl transferase domain-containing protein